DHARGGARRHPEEPAADLHGVVVHAVCGQRLVHRAHQDLLPLILSFVISQPRMARWIALTRDVSPSLPECELTHLRREPIDVSRAIAQHDAYCRVLANLGAQVIRLPADPALP